MRDKKSEYERVWLVGFDREEYMKGSELCYGECFDDVVELYEDNWLG